jgi:hypothetical protein
MAIHNIKRFDGILLQSDLECEGSIVCKHGVFVGNLLITDRHGFKVFKRRDVVPAAVKAIETESLSFYLSDASSCLDWYRKMLVEGYFQTIEQVFPVENLYVDFSEIDYSQEVELLKERLDTLDLVNMLTQNLWLHSKAVERLTQKSQVKLPWKRVLVKLLTHRRSLIDRQRLPKRFQTAMPQFLWKRLVH